jgi:hypothetical protein
MSTPPADVAEAAAKVQRWLDSAPPVTKTADEIAKMSAKERLEYARLWDQQKMPAWKDPRA